MKNKYRIVLMFFTLISFMLIYVAITLFIESKYHKFSQNDLLNNIVDMSINLREVENFTDIQKEERTQNNLKIFEKYYDFKFIEYDKNFKNHDYEIFQKHYHYYFYECLNTKTCQVNENLYMKSKLVCLVESTDCYLNKLKEKCTSRQCDFIKKYDVFLQLLDSCKNEKLENSLKEKINKDLINYYILNKETICNNYENQSNTNLLIERYKFDYNYKFISELNIS